MADVAPRRTVRPGRSGGRRDADRGQILLVTALSLAILFVALALILNTTIYTENLATRSSDIGGGTDAVRYHDATSDGVGGVIEYVNYHNNTSKSTLRAELFAGINDYHASAARQFAHGDRAVGVIYRARSPGTRIAQTDESRDFTNASGTASWTVVGDVNNVRAFRMHVFRSNLLDVLSNGFVVVLDDGSTEWNMTVYKPVSGELELVVDGPTASGDCTATGDDAWINVSEGTFGGERCDVLTTMGDGLTGSYDVQFEDADEVRGSYTFVVDNDTLAGSPGPHLNSPGDGQPFATHAIYSATVEIVYQTPRLYYEATLRVAPGEPR